MKKILLSLFFLSILIFPSYVSADGPYLNIPPTNAFDKIRSDNGSITSQNFSMPLIVKGGSGIQVKSNNSTHTLQISSTISQATGTYNTTQANNVNKNTGGYQINFINGTGATVNVQNSHLGNQVNVTVSATGTAGVTSLNALTGALTIACVSGNTTCPTSGGNTITVNTAYNVVVTGGSSQNITKTITITGSFIAGGSTLAQHNLNLASTNNEAVLQLSDSNTGGKSYQLFSTGGTSGLGQGHFTIYDLTDAKTLLDFTSNQITNYVDTLFKTKITQYNSINTAGWGVPAIYGKDFRQGITTIDGSPITVYTVPAGGSQMFRITQSIYETAFTSGTATYNIKWTENGNTLTQGINVGSINGFNNNYFIINPDANTNIQVQLQGTFVGTVTLMSFVEQIS